jgi:hypothetical protein
MAKPPSFQIETARFVRFTVLLKDYPAVKRAFNATDAPFSFGDNNRTLVSLKRFMDFVYSACELDGSVAAKRAFAKLDAKVKELESSTYIDLEN